MHISRRTLTGSDGSLLGIGDKLTVVEGLGRVSNETRRVFDLWQQAGRAQGIPALADLGLAAIEDLLPSVLVVEVLGAERDYRYRSCGAREVTVRGGDPTGRTVRQCHEGDILDFVLESYDRVAGSGEGLIDLSVDISSSKRFVAIEVLFLPLSATGAAVTDILVYSHYIDTQPETAH